MEIIIPHPDTQQSLLETLWPASAHQRHTGHQQNLSCFFSQKKNAKKVADVEMQCNALINCLIPSSQQLT